MRLTTVVCAALTLTAVVAGAEPRHVIVSARVNRSSLNVAADEDVTLAIDFGQPGAASVLVLDRDGYSVRTLALAQPVHGTASFLWNGRDDRGQLVADEAYAFRVEWRGDGAVDVYNPGEEAAPASAIDVGSYDRRTGTLTYTLPGPSRVHVQAGTAVPDPKTKKLVGPVMRTVVNREPRIGGAIAEHWNGYDESDTIFVADLDNFVVAIAASPLPENSVLTFGNRQRRFVDTLAARGGASFFHRHGHEGHHLGLRTEDDLSPVLKIEPLNATWSQTEHTWISNDAKRLRVRMTIVGPTASAFRRHPATLELFVDGRRVDQRRATTDVVEIPLDQRNAPQRISINWNSEWGPVAANTIQVRSVERSGTARSGK
ncbi:MAG TPA: FlgD immunoglobulin-like domain containing protein [Gemmatimonadaceae bacterium]|nr:MAG: hypothetical protein DMF56_12725 [Acidobacteriota bacterium]HTD82186.1 FlgD immunoglobulin-like domain containing protein [Gemmatimonadaceae bacterium]